MWDYENPWVSLKIGPAIRAGGGYLRFPSLHDGPGHDGGAIATCKLEKTNVVKNVARFNISIRYIWTVYTVLIYIWDLFNIQNHVYIYVCINIYIYIYSK